MNNKIVKGLIVGAGVISSAIIGRIVVVTVKNRNSKKEEGAE